VRIIRFVHLFLLALLFCGIAAQPLSPALSAPLSSKEQAAKDAATAETIKQLERDKAEARYQKDIAEIKAEVIQSQTSWFSILATLFGALVTAVVIFFTLRFDSNAREKMDAALQASKAQSDQAIAEAKTQSDAVLQEAKAIVAEMNTHNQDAKTLLDGIRAGAAPTDPETIKSIEQLAQGASNRPRIQRTADDYRALVTDAYIKANWAEMERHASAMVYLFDGEVDEEHIAFALTSKAYALGKLGEHDDEIAAYNSVIERFGGSDRPEMQEHVAMALVNKGIALGQQGKHDDAAATFNVVIERFRPEMQEQVAMALINKGIALGQQGKHDDAAATFNVVIERFVSSDRPEMQEQVAMALINKGIALGQQGKLDDEIVAYNAVIERFVSSDRPKMQERCAYALFNKGCALAQLGELQACVDALETWAEKRGGIDCDAIRNEPDFDPIRDDAIFTAFMVRHGCTATEPTT
jgi:tetratricopeptide (TPR) repeat protein